MVHLVGVRGEMHPMPNTGHGIISGRHSVGVFIPIEGIPTGYVFVEWTSKSHRDERGGLGKGKDITGRGLIPFQPARYAPVDR